MSPYTIAVRVLGHVRRRLRARTSRRAAARFASACAAAGRPPGAILLLERLGDFVAASAVVALVRELHPELRIAWFGRERYRALALAVPGVDEYVAVDCYGELADVVRGLAGWRVFDLHLNGKSCACCGGSWRNLSGNTDVDTENYYDFGPLAAAFATVAGIPWRPTAPALQPAAAAPGTMQLAGRYAVVHSESEESARNWHEDGWRRLVDELLQHTDLNVVHVGTRPAPWLPAHARTRELGGATSPTELRAVVAACALFVGIDSGVAHFANESRRPGLVLLGRYRRFHGYIPYSGCYGTGEGGGGAFLLRYASECAFLPWTVVARALRTVLRRLAATVPVGLGGPWDVRAHEIGDPDAARQVRQDARDDVAVVLFVDGDESAWVDAWPGRRDQLVLAFDLVALQQRIAQHGEGSVLEALESSGTRFVVERDVRETVPPAFTASPRYLHHEGAPVVFGAKTTGPALLTLDATAGERAAAGACRWYRCDVRGQRPADASARLRSAAALVTDDPAPAVESPRPGTLIVPAPPALRAVVDSVHRSRNGGAMRVIGWAFLESTQTPPSSCCIAAASDDGRCIVRRTLPFSRLERPDIAAAFATRGALFSGMRIDVAPEERSLGRTLAVLVSDREGGGWQRVPLPSRTHATLVQRAARFLRPFAGMQTFTDLYRHRFILENLVSKNLKVLYRNMALGVLWSVVNPLIMVVVLTMVWVVFFGQKISFALSVLVALVPYNLFVYCLSGCTSAIRDNVNLVKKVAFPRQILPVSVVLTHCIQFPIPLALVVVGLLVIPKENPTLTWHLLWLVPIFVIQLGLSFGVGFLVAALNAKYRDMRYIVESVLVVLFWVCPILYSASATLNERIAAGTLPSWTWYAYFLNPLAGLLESWRSVLYWGRAPEPAVLVMTLVTTLVIGAIGVRKFWVHEREFADLV